MSSRVCPASGISSPSCADPPTSPTSGSIAAQANAACSAAGGIELLKYVLGNALSCINGRRRAPLELDCRNVLGDALRDERGRARRLSRLA
jgi:hypothetical protein